MCMSYKKCVNCTYSRFIETDRFRQLPAKIYCEVTGKYLTITKCPFDKEELER